MTETATIRVASITVWFIYVCRGVDLRCPL